MAIKKYTSGAWAPTSYRKFGTETDTITSIPAQIIGDGQPITSCQIYGNTVQHGTPTPEAPVDVVGCGVRTENLCSNVAYKLNRYIDEQGVEIVNDRFNIYSVFCNSNTTYTISLKSPLIGTTLRIHAYNNGVWISQTATTAIQNMPMTFTTPNNADEIRVSIVNSANGDIMLNTGSAALPYEPYGFKLPLTVNGVEYPIYLGQVETTRRIRKLVLTGEENWNGYYGVVYLYNITNYLKTDAAIAICTHYQPQPSVIGVGETTVGHITFSKGSNFRLCIKDNNYTTETQFKSYLAAQYAAGTPVTVWYVLATPETAIINEPLHKISNYADTVTATNVPITGILETFDVGTTLKPSEVQLTYHGWHEHEDTKYTQGE